MRNLSVAQKHLLKKAFNEDPSIQQKENLPTKTIKIIENINIYENMDSDIDRYLIDLWMENNAG